MSDRPTGPFHALALASLLLLSTFLVGGRAAALLMVVVVVCFPVLLIGCCPRRERPGPAFLAALSGWLVAVALAIVLPAASGTDPRRVAGLPLTSWLMLVGLGLAPFVLTTVGYVRTFRAGRGGPER